MTHHISGAGYASGAYSPTRGRKKATKASAHKKTLRKLRKNKDRY